MAVVKIGDDVLVLEWHVDWVSGPYANEFFVRIENVGDTYAFFGGAKSGKCPIERIEDEGDDGFTVDSMHCEFDDDRHDVPFPEDTPLANVYEEFGDLYGE